MSLSSAAPDSPRQRQSHSSPAPTKTRSTSSPRVRRSAPSNCPAPCISPQLRSPRRTRTTQRWVPAARSLRGRCHFTAPPLRSQRAPAQTTTRRSPALPQRLQTPRQTAQPSARTEAELASASGSHASIHRPPPLTVPPTPPSALPGEPPSLCADPLNPLLSLHDVATMSRITTFATTTKTRHLNVVSCIMSELSLAGKDLMVKGYIICRHQEGRMEHYGWGWGGMHFKLVVYF